MNDIEQEFIQCEKKIFEINQTINQLKEKILTFDIALKLGDIGLDDKQKRDLLNKKIQCEGVIEQLLIVIKLWNNRKKMCF